MELRHLRYFLAVAETLHFSRAAVRLHLTQPALSRQIRDLEGELGVALLRRHGTETRLTAAGEHFLKRTREILDLAERSVREVKDAAQVVRLGHYGALWVDYYGSALRAFAKRFPKVSLQAVEQTPVELVQSLRRGDVDIALLGPAAPELHKEFSVRRLGELPALIALGSTNPFAKRRKIALADLRAATWIVWDEKDFPGRVALLHDAAKLAGFTARIAGKVDSVASLFVQLASSEAVGYVLPMTKKLPHAGVVFAELRPPGIRFAMDVAWRRGVAASSPVAVLARLLATPSRTGDE